MALLAVAAFVCTPALAQDAAGTLYDQDGTANDGYDTIDATGQGPANASSTNWKYQYGAGSYTGIYRKDGWHDVETTGDSKIDIECDIEMYYTESFENNKIYFHIGDPFNATETDKTAYVDGTVSYNNGMYVGISFDGTSKTGDDMLKDGEGNYTGVVKDAMVGTVDVLGRQMYVDKDDPSQGYVSFDAKFTLSWDGGTTYNVPITFGTGASGTVLNTLWWLVDDGKAGAYNLQYKVEMVLKGTEPDGNYHFDPAIVATPKL